MQIKTVNKHSAFVEACLFAVCIRPLIVSSSHAMSVYELTHETLRSMYRRMLLWVCISSVSVGSEGVATAGL